MKTFSKTILIIAFIAIALVSLTGCASQDARRESRTIIGETYTLERDRIFNGDLNVIGGVVVIEETATVNGNLFVLGGLVTVNGTVKGDLTAIGGTVNINETAVLEGDLISPVSYININPNASVLGEEIDQWIIPSVGLQQITNLSPQPSYPQTITAISILLPVGRFLAFTLLLAGLGAFLLLIMPKPTDRMANALITKPWPLLGFGALTTLVMFNAALLSLTICLIPLVILVGLVYTTALLVGWLTLGYILGKRIASGIFNTTWHPITSAALGNLILYLIAWGVSRIPCVGWFPVFITMQFALGMVIATLFGTYTYPRTPGEEEEQVILFSPDAEPSYDKPVDKAASPEMTVPDIDDSPAVVVEAAENLSAVPAEALDAQTQPIDEEFSSLEETPLPTTIFNKEDSIEVLNLTTRITNLLTNAGINTITDVLKRLESGDEGMLEIEGFGEKSLTDLKQALMDAGYHLP